jgi:type I restriction enzyme S subunit
MDAQTFLAEFRHIASATGGIARLRQMIYQLAVTGFLTPRGNSAEDAGQLLSRIAQERQRLIWANGYKRMPKLESEPIRPPQGIKLPESWRWSRLLDIGEINPRNEASDDLLAAFIPMSGVPQLHKEPIVAEIKRWGLINRGYTHFAVGDVVLAKITPCFENGKAAAIENLPGDAGIGAGTTELHVFRPIHAGILAGYVYLFLRSPLFSVDGEKHMTGTAGQKRVPTDYFATCAFPLPPTEEQAVIVAKVDELMALCDRLEEQHKERLALQSQLSETTLSAVATAQGQAQLKVALTRIDRNLTFLVKQAAHVTELRELFVTLAIRGVLYDSRILDKFFSRDIIESLTILKSGKRIAKSQNVEPLFPLPKNWCWTLLEDLLSGSEAGWSPKCDEVPRRHGEWGVLKISAVTWGEFRHQENKRLPPSLAPKVECEIKPGDFILSRANTAELIARSVIVQEDAPEKLLMSDKIVRLKFLDERLKRWVNLVNNARISREYYQKNATGTSDSMRNVSRKVIHELPIPLPPLRVQEAILHKLDLINEVLSNLEMLLKKERRLSDQLSRSAVDVLIGAAHSREEDKSVKAPQTELIAPLRLGATPDVKELAPLATILARHQGEMSAKDLWQRFGSEIDLFYAQLKTEVANGWIQEPAVAEMREVPQPQASA